MITRDRYRRSVSQLHPKGPGRRRWHRRSGVEHGSRSVLEPVKPSLRHPLPRGLSSCHRFFPFTARSTTRRSSAPFESRGRPPYDIIDADRAEHLFTTAIRTTSSGWNSASTDRGQSDEQPIHPRSRDPAGMAQDGSLQARRPAGRLLSHDRIRPPYSAPALRRRCSEDFWSRRSWKRSDSGQIYPHENTRAAAKTDRLNLLEACRANFSPIWSAVFRSPGTPFSAARKPPSKASRRAIDFQDDAGRQRAVGRDGSDGIETRRRIDERQTALHRRRPPPL